jgi:hypothetical protein
VGHGAVDPPQAVAVAGKQAGFGKLWANPYHAELVLTAGVRGVDEDIGDRGCPGLRRPTIIEEQRDPFLLARRQQRPGAGLPEPC